MLPTSREHDMFSKDIGTHKEFHVQQLCEEEAWSLFEETTNDSRENLELQYVATKVVKE